MEYKYYVDPYLTYNNDLKSWNAESAAAYEAEVTSMIEETTGLIDTLSEWKGMASEASFIAIDDYINNCTTLKNNISNSLNGAISATGSLKNEVSVLKATEDELIGKQKGLAEKQKKDIPMYVTVEYPADKTHPEAYSKSEKNEDYEL